MKLAQQTWDGSAYTVAGVTVVVMKLEQSARRCETSGLLSRVPVTARAQLLALQWPVGTDVVVGGYVGVVVNVTGVSVRGSESVTVDRGGSDGVSVETGGYVVGCFDVVV